MKIISIGTELIEEAGSKAKKAVRLALTPKKGHIEAPVYEISKKYCVDIRISANKQGKNSDIHAKVMNSDKNKQENIFLRTERKTAKKIAKEILEFLEAAGKKLAPYFISE